MTPAMGIGFSEFVDDDIVEQAFEAIKTELGRVISDQTEPDDMRIDQGYEEVKFWQRPRRHLLARPLSTGARSRRHPAILRLLGEQ